VGKLLAQIVAEICTRVPLSLKKLRAYR